MNLLLGNRRALARKINYLLGTVGLSLRIVSGLHRYRVYRLLKKANRLWANQNLSKKDLKALARIISEGGLQTGKTLVRIARFFFKLTKAYARVIAFLAPFVLTNIFLSTFFGRNTIMRC